MKPKRITTEGLEMMDKTVVPLGNSGKIGVPKSWIGCRVAVIRMTEPAKVKK